MRRTLFDRILVIFRLAIIGSLVGYTMPNAYAAMHGSIYSDVEVSAASDHHDGSHSHPIQMDHVDNQLDQNGPDLAKQSKKDCCQDFCFSAALPSDCHSYGPLTVSAVLRFFNDNHLPGTRPSLHRPPNI